MHPFIKMSTSSLSCVEVARIFRSSLWGAGEGGGVVEGESAFNFRCNFLGICFIRGDCSLPSSSAATCSVFQRAFRADITVRNNMTVLHSTVRGVCHVDSCNSAVSLATSFSNVSFSVSSAAVLFRFTCSLFSRVWRSGPHMTSISWHRALVNTAKEVKIVSTQVHTMQTL